MSVRTPPTGTKTPCNYRPQIRCFHLCYSLMLAWTKELWKQFIVTCIFLVSHACDFFSVYQKVSSKFCECRFMYYFLAHDRWGADWEKGRVACWQTEAMEAQRWTWNSPAAALQHYITTDFTVMAAAASCHRQDVIGWEQLDATAVSHATEPSTGEAGKQAAIGWGSVRATNTLPV